jgi:predicted YcjX-like family ATPase
MINKQDILDRAAEWQLRPEVVEKDYVPSSEDLVAMVRSNEELKAQWANMLAHQPPNLPVIDDMVTRFEALIGWIDQPGVRAARSLPWCGRPGFY